MQKNVWNGTMKLGNVVAYLARDLDLPIGAIEINFKWPSKTGKICTVTDHEKRTCNLTQLRSVWR